MNSLKLLILIGIVLIALPANANHGIEAMGDGLVEMAKYAVLSFLIALILIGSILLRFTLHKPIFSIGVYLSGAILLLFTLKNYTAALEDYENRESISDSYPRPMVPEILESAQEQLSNAAFWFYLSLFLLLVYLALDIWVARKHKLKSK